MQPVIRLLFIFLLQIVANPIPQSPLGKSHLQVIGMRGVEYKKLFDRGYPILEYKTTITNDSVGAGYTLTELIYFEQDTCIKDVVILPAKQLDSCVNSFNLQFKPSGFHSWIGPDSSFIAVSVRDNLLDITSFSAAYYKKLAGR